MSEDKVSMAEREDSVARERGGGACVKNWNPYFRGNAENMVSKLVSQVRIKMNRLRFF